jgi:hypothetical protein
MVEITKINKLTRLVYNSIKVFFKNYEAWISNQSNIKKKYIKNIKNFELLKGRNF